tara:strand:+ start:16881 stop:17951 length:1071 start_codon:yes stop_codon:yes gene_type:complete
MKKNIFKEKKILITGHTGFKGSWLTLWLLLKGAKIIGLSKNINTRPSHFQLLNIKKKIKHYQVDLKNLSKIKKIINNSRPDYIFHLAAQALVKNSYDNPIETWSSNSIGTIHLLEALRKVKKKTFVILITSDKSYKNLELDRGYKEDDLIGGKDPYSASKASAELAIQSYINSFFSHKNNKVFISVARAGNVIGGGDWSENRLVPDCFKKWSKNRFVDIRNPNSTRPWQHVLEALNGYLILAKKMTIRPKNFHGEVFNFGPKNFDNNSVLKVLKKIKSFYPAAKWNIRKNKKFHESNLLKLNSKKAKKKLNWECKLSFSDNIRYVTEWYKSFYDRKQKINICKLSSEQIRQYEKIK